MKRRTRVGAILLLLLGLVLVLGGLAGTLRQPNVLEYTILAPQETESVTNLVKRREKALSDIADAMQSSCVAAFAKEGTVSAEEGSASSTVTVQAGSEGFFAVYPRYLLSGRLISETELSEGATIIVLDEGTAFSLFPTIDPVGQKVNFFGTTFEVVGVVRETGKLPFSETGTVYIPLLALPVANYDIFTLSAVPAIGASAGIMLKTAASDSWQSGGELWSYAKEVARARLPILYGLCLFAFAGLIALLRKVTQNMLWAVSDIRRRLRNVYPASVIAPAALYILSLLLTYAVVLTGMYLVAKVAVAPLLSFPEWVPENIVEWKSICAVLRTLVRQDTQMVRFATTGIRLLSVFRGMILWGTICTLSGTVLQLLAKRE